MYFSFLSFYISLMYTSFVTIYWHTLYLSFLIYMMMMYVFSLISTCVVSFLFLYTCFFMYATLFLFHTWCLNEFFFKCFRKTSCESLPCHELSSWKVFQEFVLGLDLFCISTSDYEFSDLRLLSWFICLLWFCHELPRGGDY